MTTRGALLVLGVLSVALFPSRVSASVPGWAAPPLAGSEWHQLFTAWERFDALWFLRIASSGYRVGDGSAAFFPLYPLTVRALSVVMGSHPFAASLVVSNGSFLAALFMLYVLTTAEVSEAVARRTVLYLSVFPSSFFFFAPYSESLFLFLVLVAFWGARRRRWGLAAFAGALAALTRGVGIVLAPALAAEALRQRREGVRRWPAGLGAALATVLGGLSYLGYWSARSEDALEAVRQQSNWLRTFTWPWITLWRATGDAFRLGGTFAGYWQIDWLILVPILVASVYVVRRFRTSHGVYVWGSLLIPLTFVFPNRPLMSMVRFVLPLFPAFWGFGVLGARSRTAHGAILVTCVAGLAFLAPLYVNWYFIF